VLFTKQNEVEFGAPLHPGMSAILQFKLTPVAFRNMVLRAQRFNAKDAMTLGMVDDAVPEDQVLSKAKEMALQVAPLAKSGAAAYKQLKDQVMKTDHSLRDHLSHCSLYRCM
jgi:enoyl-CoA hydratase/carnithine racemase